MNETTMDCADVEVARHGIIICSCERIIGRCICASCQQGAYLWQERVEQACWACTGQLPANSLPLYTLPVDDLFTGTEQTMITMDQVVALIRPADFVQLVSSILGMPARYLERVFSGLPEGALMPLRLLYDHQPATISVDGSASITVAPCAACDVERLLLHGICVECALASQLTG